MNPWTTSPSTSWPPTTHSTTSATSWIPTPTTMTAPTRPHLPWPTTMPPHYQLHPQLLATEHPSFSIHTPAVPGHSAPPTDHLFGQPSNLQAALPSTSTPPPNPHTSPTFASLAVTAHPAPPTPLTSLTMPSTSEAPLLRPDMPDLHAAPSINIPWTASTHPAIEPLSLPSPTPPSNPPPVAHPRASRPRQPKANPPVLPNPRHTAVKAAPKVRPDRTSDRPRRTQPPSNPPPIPTTSAPDPTPDTPTMPTQAELAAIANTTQQLQDSFRLLQAQQAQQQHFMYDTFTALHQRRLEDQLLATSHPSKTTSTPPPNPTPPANNPPAPSLPTTTTTNDANPPSSTPPRVPQPRAPTSTSPPPRKRSRPRRDSRPRSRRPRRDAHHSPGPRHRRPRSPLPRHRSTTANPKHRRTPSPQRRRSPPRHRSNPRHRQPAGYRSPPNTVYRQRDDRYRSRTPTRHPRTSDIVLTPAHRTTNPEFIPTPDADDTWGNWNNEHNPPAPVRPTRPTSPRNPPRAMPPPEAPPGATTSRMPTGDSENSEVDDGPMSLVDFEQNDNDLHEMQAAANDPTRVKCVTELDASHTVTLRHELVGESKVQFKQFVDEMLHQLAKPYTTSNGETIFIRANPAVVNNIARAFGQADRLDITYAQGTQGFYVEQENLLTITVPTGLPEKPIYKNDHSATYMIYHKTSWDIVPKILVEDCIRPASWSTDEQGHPSQYPCYGFFGMSAEIGDHRKLASYAVKQCTSQLYKIGKGQMPSGLLAICRSPKCTRTQAGGNDQLQRLCKLHGISRGKDGASAMNSSAATVAFVACTHTLHEQLITRVTNNSRPAEASATGDNPESTSPDPPTPLPASTSHTAPPSHPAPSHHSEPDYPPSYRDSHSENRRQHHPRLGRLDMAQPFMEGYIFPGPSPTPGLWRRTSTRPTQ